MAHEIKHTTSAHQLPEIPNAARETASPLTASCHCGRVTLNLPSLPRIINECHCTICYRYGARWGYYRRPDVEITVSNTDKNIGLMSYVRGDPDGVGDTGFYWCTHCGCLTHWWYLDEDGDRDKMGVNTRMLTETSVKGVEMKISYD